MHVTRCLAEVLLAGSLVLVVPAGIAGAADSSRERTSTENETPEFERANLEPTCADKIAKLALGMNDGGLAGVIAPDNHADSGQPNDNDATLGARRTRSVHRALMTVAICQPDFGWPLRHAGGAVPGHHPKGASS